MGNTYYIVAFTRDNPLSQEDKFFWLGHGLFEKSKSRLPSFLSDSAVEDLEYAVVRRLTRIQQPTLSQRLMLKLLPKEAKQIEGKPGKDITLYFQSPAEFKAYDMVYFLNEVALKMYREGEVEFEILRAIPEDQLPDQAEECLVGPYVSLASSK